MYLQGMKPMREQKKDEKAAKKQAKKPSKAAGAEASKEEAKASRNKRAWHQKKLTPAQIQVICERFHGGSHVRDLMAEYNISRSSLYRYLEEYEKGPDLQQDVAYWRIECQRVKDLAMELALENKDLRAKLAARERKS